MPHAERFRRPYNTCWTIPQTCWRCMPSISGKERRSFFTCWRNYASADYETPICLYGFFPTLAWKDILDEHPTVDYVVVGEPEDTLVDLARG